MAIEKVVNITVNTKGSGQAIAQTEKLNQKFKQLQATTGELKTGLKESSNAVLENGGAMGLLNDLTGGMAMTVKDAVEATALFTKGTTIATTAQKVYTLVVGSTTGALKALRIALVSTGLGAIVVLLGLFISKMMDSADATEKEKNATDALNKSLQAMSDLYKENIQDIQDVTKERVLRAKIAGKSEADIQKIEKEGADARYKLYKDEDARIQKEKQNKKLTAEQSQKLRDEELANQRAYFKSLDDEKIKDLEGDLSKADAKRANLKANNEKLIADRAAEAQRLKDEAAANAKKLLDEAKSISQRAKEQNDNVFKTDLERLEEKYLAEKTLLEAQNLSTEELTTEYWNKQNELLLGQQKIVYDINQKAIDDKIEQDKKAAEAQIEIDKRVAAQKKSIQEGQLNLASSAVGLLTQIAGKNKALQKASIIADSALGIGKSIIATNASNVAATAEGAALAIPTAGASVAAAAKLVLLNNIALGIGTAANIAATAKALSALGGGGGAGGGSAGQSGGQSAPSFNLVQGTGSNQIAQGLASSKQPLKAFVVSSEQKTAEALDRNIVNEASI